jgi:hypothetical protein
MADDDPIELRIELAEALLVSAEHSSEAEIRNSLSRMYYAIYHLATIAVGSMAHGEFAASLNKLEPDLGTSFKRFEDLRSRADYNPHFVLQEFGDFRGMRAAFPTLLQEGRDLYERLLELIRQNADANSQPN